VGAAVGWVVAEARMLGVVAAVDVGTELGVEVQPTARNAAAVASPIESSRFMRIPSRCHRGRAGSPSQNAAHKPGNPTDETHDHAETKTDQG
jgi:hypothetical protein